MPLNLTPEEISTLVNACHVANERFRECLQINKASGLPKDAQRRLDAQFESQIKDTAAVLEKLEQHQLVEAVT